MAQELLTLQNLAKYYTSAQSVVVGLNQLNLTFCRGEFVAITGESGSGKSTLAHVLGGILPYEGGELLYKGKPTSHYDSADWERYRRDCVSFISQSYGILPGSTVLDNVTCALHLVGFSKDRAVKDAEEILKKVELWDLRRRRAAKLSSGQKQRLSIARALAKPAPVLIADEPTGNLDAENSAMVIKLLAEAARDRLVILITHEFSEAEDYATRRIELHDGVVTMDAQLREAPELPVTRPEEKGAAVKEKKHLSWFVSRFQIKARPVWAVLMLCLFAFTVFAMFATSGTFISNLDDTFTYYYDNSAFLNGDSKRIVVVRPDGGEFTQKDIEKILSVRYVDSVEEWGYVTDIQYAYREGIDYEVKYNLEEVGNEEYTTVSSYSVNKTQQYMP
ncbi:MAG: ABC transporter ATP-binding protein, partial [Oscillospiraceae bacterium]|nr:ABC transporter ATP-binding protein [Oscillospiraceae bacterium]